MSAALELTAIRRSHHDGTGEVVVLDGVDLVVDAGEVVALVGRSGSGKTTLLQVAAGFERPDAGTVRRLGRDAGAAVPAWSELAVVPQTLGLLDELTVAENVALPGRLKGRRDRADVAAALDEVGVGHLADRLPGACSLGEQQRATIARAAVARPRILLADEPVAHQNDELGRTVLAVLARLAAEGTAVLVVSHDPAVVDVAHRVVRLDRGRLHPGGPPDRSRGV